MNKDKSSWKEKIVDAVIIIAVIATIILNIKLGNLDEVWHFGKGVALINRRIYSEVDLIVTPLSYMIIKLACMINKSIFTYRILSIILTSITFIFYKIMLDKINKSSSNWIIVIFIASLQLSVTYFFQYNTLIELLILIAFYIDMLKHKEKHDSIIIGLVIGTIFLTKQTLVVLAIAPLIVRLKRKDFKEAIKLMASSIIIPLIYMIYLIANNELDLFITSCFKSIFMFSGNNKIDKFTICIISIVAVQYIIAILMKVRKDEHRELIVNNIIYSVVSMICLYPILDISHAIIPLMFMCIVVALNKFKLTNAVIAIPFILAIMQCVNKTDLQIIDTGLYKGLYTTKENCENIKLVDKFIEEHNEKGENIVVYCCEALLYKPDTNYQKYYSLPLNGTTEDKSLEDLAKELVNKENTLILIRSDNNINWQMSIEAIEIIREHTEKVGTIGSYDILKKKRTGVKGNENINRDGQKKHL